MPITRIVTGVIEDGTITSTDMAVDPRNASNLNAGDVPLAQLGNVETTTGLKDDIAILAFKTQANGNLARYNLVDQSVDSFEDASGIDASASTNEARDSSGKYYYGENTVTPTVSGNYDSTGTDGAYTWYKWTTVTSSGSYTTNTAQDYEYLVIAGGGGGGSGHGGTGVGGGGAGGYRTATGFPVAATTIGSITVGAGAPGQSSSNNGGKGSNSSFSTISATGGSGGRLGNSNGVPGGSGGGGGGGYGSGTQTGGPGNEGGYSPVEGYPGGDGVANSSNGGGGGGGAGSVGIDGSGGSGGNGGLGLSSAIDGTPTFRASGGGGSGGSGPDGAANPGGGGAGNRNGDGGDGTANTGGGGGGCRASNTSGDGGSGIVIIRRPTTETSAGGNMTLVSNSTTAQAAPTKGDLVFTYTNGAGTAVVGTNITAEYSADNGSTWTDFGIAAGDVQGTTGGHTIVTKNNVALTSTSGTSMRYRIKTLVQSASLITRIHAVSLGWS